MLRVTAFIDGFNLYHSLIESGFNGYKWLNYKSLAKAFINNSTEIITDVFYFSALPRWDYEKTVRHKLYIRALETENINVVLGRFKKVTKKCRVFRKNMLHLKKKKQM